MGSRKKASPLSTGKVHKVLAEWKNGVLHSGSPQGPVVTNQKQAVAIALDEAKKAGQKVPKKKSNRNKSY